MYLTLEATFCSVVHSDSLIWMFQQKYLLIPIADPIYKFKLSTLISVLIFAFLQSGFTITMVANAPFCNR